MMDHRIGKNTDVVADYAITRDHDACHNEDVVTDYSQRCDGGCRMNHTGEPFDIQCKAGDDIPPRAEGRRAAGDGSRYDVPGRASLASNLLEARLGPDGVGGDADLAPRDASNGFRLARRRARD